MSRHVLSAGGGLLVTNDTRTGPTLTKVRGLALSFESKSEAETERPKYERALKTTLVSWPADTVYFVVEEEKLPTINLRTVATTAMFLMEGVMDAGGRYNAAGKSDRGTYMESHGYIETMEQLAAYAEFSERLVVALPSEQNWPGVYDYEVSSEFGDWWFTHVLENGEPPTPKSAKPNSSGASRSSLRKEIRRNQRLQCKVSIQSRGAEHGYGAESAHHLERKRRRT